MQKSVQEDKGWEFSGSWDWRYRDGPKVIFSIGFPETLHFWWHSPRVKTCSSPSALHPHPFWQACPSASGIPPLYFSFLCHIINSLRSICSSVPAAVRFFFYLILLDLCLPLIWALRFHSCTAGQTWALWVIYWYCVSISLSPTKNVTDVFLSSPHIVHFSDCAKEFMV